MFLRFNDILKQFGIVQKKGHLLYLKEKNIPKQPSRIVWCVMYDSSYVNKWMKGQ